MNYALVDIKLALRVEVDVQPSKSICRLFPILSQFPFTTSSRELGFYSQKVKVRVV